jgi:AraC family ethanolamine operon transcriptional activator
MQHAAPPPLASTPLAPHPWAPGAVVSASFSDIDEQAAALTGWNQSYLQISAGRFHGVVQRLQFDGIGLFVEELQQAVHQTGHVQPQVVALGVPALLEGDSRFCGETSHAGALHVFSGRGGFEFRSPQRHVMIGIELDGALFESQVLDGSAHAADRFSASARLQSLDPTALTELRQFLLALFEQAARNEERLSTQPAPGGVMAAAATRMRDELLDRLAAAVAPSAGAAAHGATTAHAPHARLADRARELVAARLEDPPTVAELCALLGVSRRTLQTCFQTTWGMGPLAWLNMLRLNAVRRHLKTAPTVTEAATALGYWHFGHFSRDYQALFGELPSHTLQRQRGVAACVGAGPH